MGLLRNNILIWVSEALEMLMIKDDVHSARYGREAIINRSMAAAIQIGMLFLNEPYAHPKMFDGLFPQALRFGECRTWMHCQGRQQVSTCEFFPSQ
jgi:hypothetical protein